MTSCEGEGARETTPEGSSAAAKQGSCGGRRECDLNRAKEGAAKRLLDSSPTISKLE